MFVNVVFTTVDVSDHLAGLLKFREGLRFVSIASSARVYASYWVLKTEEAKQKAPYPA